MDPNTTYFPPQIPHLAEVEYLNTVPVLVNRLENAQLNLRISIIPIISNQSPLLKRWSEKFIITNGFDLLWDAELYSLKLQVWKPAILPYTLLTYGTTYKNFQNIVVNVIQEIWKLINNHYTQTLQM